MNKDLFPKKDPFQVPPDYFVRLEKVLMEAVSDDLPISKDTPFNVPDGYFSELNNTTLTGKTKSNNSTYWIVSIAACALVIFILTFNGSGPVPEKEPSMEIATSSETDVLLSYVEDHYLEDIEISDIQGLLDEETDESGLDLTNAELSEFFRDNLEIEELLNEL